MTGHSEIYSELKPLLDACLAENCNDARAFRKACDALFDVCTIETIAGLVEQQEALVSALNEILKVTPMEVEAFGIAALALGELGVSKESSNV